MSVSHQGKPLVSFVSASPNNACLCPIATKEFEYRRFWWSGALRNLIVGRRRKNDLTCLHFSRGIVAVVVGHVPQTSFVVFYYFPASPSSRTSPPLFAFRSHLSKKYHDYFNSRLILPADRRGIARGDPLFYTEPPIPRLCRLHWFRTYLKIRNYIPSTVSELAVHLTLEIW